MKGSPVLVLWAAAGLAFAQPEPTPPQADAGDYEELPELKASEILSPSILNGPHHQVREEVSTSDGANRFTIDSHYGVFEAIGNEMLVRRVNEINAIAELKEVSRTEQYKNALVQAAKSPLNAAKNLVTDPVNTLKSAPKGVMKFMSKTGESIKSIGKKKDADSGTDGNKIQQMIGFTDAKRKVAISLGVDPYSSNAVLQKELDGIAWASFAGGATFKLGTMPIGGAAGAALTTVELSGNLEKILSEKSPADLKAFNRKSLMAMGATEKETNQLMGNSAFSPTAQTAFVLNLNALNGVENRRAFISLAGRTSSSEEDAIFCVQTAALMDKLHKEKPLARIELLGDFPYCVSKDGKVIVALQWDYAAWTPTADKFVHDLLAKVPPNSQCLIAITGTASPRIRQQLEARHFEVQDRLAPGPLK